VFIDDHLQGAKTRLKEYKEIESKIILILQRLLLENKTMMKISG